MINSVVLVGNITRDIELKKTPSNISYCRFTVACNRKYQSQQNGGNGPTADFINCVAWRQSADFLAQYASKGSTVGIQGHITTGSYDGQNGKVYTTEVTCENVQMISRGKNNSQQQNANTEPRQTFTPSVEPNYAENETEDDFSNTPSLDISSDDLPFY